MKYLLLMTFAGSFLYEAYLIWIRLGKKFISESMRYKALILVLLFYIVPLVWLKGFYTSFFRTFFRLETVSGSEDLVEMSDIFTGRETYIIRLVLFGVWISIALYMMLKRCINYFRHRQYLRKLCEKCSNEENIKKLIKSLKKELHYIGRIEVLQMKGGNGNFTTGFLKPIIVLKEKCTEEELEWVLRHEMVHIAQGAALVKWLSELACCIHWFNPIALNMERQVAAVREFSCDERASRNHAPQEREVYARLIYVNMQNRMQSLMGSCFGGDLNIAEERLRIILKTEKTKKWRKLIAASLFLMMLLAVSLMALAYPCTWSV